MHLHKLGNIYYAANPQNFSAFENFEAGFCEWLTIKFDCQRWRGGLTFRIYAQPRDLALSPARGAQFINFNFTRRQKTIVKLA